MGIEAQAYHSVSTPDPAPRFSLVVGCMLKTAQPQAAQYPWLPF